MPYLTQEQMAKLQFESLKNLITDESQLILEKLGYIYEESTSYYGMFKHFTKKLDKGTPYTTWFSFTIDCTDLSMRAKLEIKDINIDYQGIKVRSAIGTGGEYEEFMSAVTTLDPQQINEEKITEIEKQLVDALTRGWEVFTDANLGELHRRLLIKEE